MYKKVIYTAAYCLLSFFLMGLSHAEESIDHNEVKISFTGNTVEGKIIQRDTNYKMYFHPSGKLIRLDSKDNSEKGIWHVNNKNELCLKFSSEACLTIKKRGDGMFDLHNQNSDLELTIVKVILGNPDKMKP